MSRQKCLCLVAVLFFQIPFFVLSDDIVENPHHAKATQSNNERSSLSGAAETYEDDLSHLSAERSSIEEILRCHTISKFLVGDGTDFISAIQKFENETSDVNFRSGSARVLPDYQNALQKVRYSLGYNYLSQSTNYLGAANVKELLNGRQWMESQILTDPQLAAIKNIKQHFDPQFNLIQREYYSNNINTEQAYEQYQQQLKDLHAEIGRILEDKKVAFDTKTFAVWYKEKSFYLDQVYMRYLRGQLYRDYTDHIIQTASPNSIQQYQHMFQLGQLLYSQQLLSSTILLMVDYLQTPDAAVTPDHLQQLNELAVEAVRIDDRGDPTKIKASIINELNDLKTIKSIKDGRKHIAQLQRVGMDINNELKKAIGFSDFEAKFGKYVTITDVLDLAIGAKQSNLPDRAVLLMGFSNALSEALISQVQSYGGDRYSTLQGSKRSTKVHDFQQIELEMRFDLIDRGHCLAYSYLFLVQEMLSGDAGVDHFVESVKDAANSYDSSRNGFLSDPVNKEKSDKFRSLLDGLYAEHFQGDKLKQIMNRNRPQSAGPPSNKLSVREILETLKNDQSSIRKGAWMGTNKHAMALSYDKATRQYKFFDSNYGVFVYADEKTARSILKNFFKETKQSYAIDTNSRGEASFTVHFMNENCAKEVHELEFGPRKTKIQDTVGAVPLPDTIQQSVSDVGRAKEYGKIMLKEFRAALGDLADHTAMFVPDFYHSTVEADTVRIPMHNSETLESREVTFGSKKMVEAVEFMKSIGEKIKSGFQWSHKLEITPSAHAEPEAIASGMLGLNYLAIIQLSIQDGADGPSPFSNSLTTAMEVFTYINVAQGGVQSIVEVVHTALLVVAKEGSLITKSLSRLSKVSNVLGAGGILLNVATVGLDITQLVEAVRTNNEVAVATSATSLTFDSLLLGLGISGFAVGGTAGAVIGYIAAPIAGLAIGLTALVHTFSTAVEETKNCLARFGDVLNGYSGSAYHVVHANGTTPQFLAADAIPITGIDFIAKTISFGPTYVCKNRRETFTQPYCVSPPQYLNLREGFDLPATIPIRFDATTETVLLPFMGTTYMAYESGYTSTPWGWRHDVPLPHLETLYTRTGGSFTFHNKGPGSYAIRKMWNVYDSLDVDVTMDSLNRTLIIPEKSSFPTHDPKVQLGHHYEPKSSWHMTYKIYGNGVRYNLILNNKGQGRVFVQLRETAGSSGSTWVLHLGQDADDTADKINEREHNIGGLHLLIDNPDATTVFLLKRNGELIKLGKQHTIESVSADWVATALKNDETTFFDRLQKLATDYNSTAFTVVDFPARVNSLGNPDGQVFNATGIYLASTQKIQFKTNDGLLLLSTRGIHPLPVKHLDLNFLLVNCSDWTLNGRDEFNATRDKFNNLSRTFDRDEINFVNLKFQGLLYSGRYSEINQTLSGWNDFGSFDVVSLKDGSKQVAAVHLDWIRKRSATLELSAYTPILHLLKQTFEDVRASTIIPLIGFKASDSMDYQNLWYNTVRNEIIAGGLGLKSRTGVEMIGWLKGVYFMFDRQQGEILWQQPLSNENLTISQLEYAPFVRSPYKAIGKIVSAVLDLSGGDSILVSNDQGFKFKIESPLRPIKLYVIPRERYQEPSEMQFKKIFDTYQCIIPETVRMLSYDELHPEGYTDTLIHTPTRARYSVGNPELMDFQIIGYSKYKRGYYLYIPQRNEMWKISSDMNPASREYYLANITMAYRENNFLLIQGLDLSSFDESKRFDVMPTDIDGVTNVLFQFAAQNKDYYLNLNWEVGNMLSQRVLVENLDAARGLPVINGIKDCPTEENPENIIPLPSPPSGNRLWITIKGIPLMPTIFHWVNAEGYSNDMSFRNERNALIFLDVKAKGVNSNWIVQSPASRDGYKSYKTTIFQLLGGCGWSKDQYDKYWSMQVPFQPLNPEPDVIEGGVFT